MLDIPDEKEDDILNIIYTSDTTGKPKGVIHSIGNISKTAQVALQVLNMPKNPRFFSYLPLLHVAKREAGEIHGMYPGVTVSFPESLDTFAADLAAAKP